MKVVMLDTGKLKEVSDGYARNFLFPKKLAKPATVAAVTEAKLLQANQAAQTTAEQQVMDATAKTLTGANVKLSVTANEVGGLFAAVSVDEIRTAISNQLHVTLAQELIDMPVIKKLGTYSIPIKRTGHSPIQLNLQVVAR